VNTTIRPECGTIRGALIHHKAGEEWCGWCLLAERTAALEAERLAFPVSCRPVPISEERAAANQAVLDREVAAFEAGGGHSSRRRWLRTVA
jgi:hypothetical protein